MGSAGFPPRDKAQALIDLLSPLQPARNRWIRNDLTIEPYDLAEHDRLIDGISPAVRLGRTDLRALERIDG